MKRHFKLRAAAVLCAPLIASASVHAAEEGKSVYLLGMDASLAGMTPPPGFYFTSLGYFYQASAGGSAAISRSLGPFGDLTTKASVKAQASVAINALSLMYVAPEKVLGGHFGVGVVAPYGYQNVDVDLTAKSDLKLPDGTTLTSSKSARVSDNTFAFGDPMATAFIGWNSGMFHWKLAGLVNIPIGSYQKSALVNMGFNRWAADITGSMTYLNPQTGFEVSLATGVTFNGENPATRYKTGTELHIGGAVMQHFTKDFAVGIAGYHYQQISGDSGAGAVLGPFKGRVSAIGPNLTYNFHIGQVPLITSVRFFHEFNEKNRMAGNAGFITLTVPLGGGGKSSGHGPS